MQRKLLGEELYQKLHMEVKADKHNTISKPKKKIKKRGKNYAEIFFSKFNFKIPEEILTLNEFKNTRTSFLLSDIEKKFLIRINKSLEKHDKKSYSFMCVLGRIKSICHRKNINVNGLILYLESMGVLWRSVRDQDRMRKYRRINPICEVCKTNKSQHTHHKIPSKDGGLEIDDNYLAVCIPCHQKLHPELPNGFIR